MRYLVNYLILCLGPLFLAGACNLKSMSSDEYLVGIGSNSSITITISNLVTNQITNGTDTNTLNPESFLNALKGREIELIDSAGKRSYGTMSGDGKQIKTNQKTTINGVNNGSDASKILATGISTYTFQGVQDSENIGIYYGEFYEYPTATIHYRISAKITITLNSDRTRGTISCYRVTTMLVYNAAIPEEHIYEAITITASIAIL